MSDIKTLVESIGIDEDDQLELYEHIRKAGGVKEGIAAYYKTLEDNVSSLRNQLKLQGEDVEVEKISIK